MAPSTKIALASLASATLIASAASAQLVSENGRRFVTHLTGAAECNSSGTCGVGDQDGSGTARLWVNLGQRRICYELEVEDILLPATGAHIHVGAAGTAPAGNIVVPLTAPDATGSSSGCAENLSRDLLRAILTNPSNYYVNVHTTDKPGGAVRGQLSRAPR